jgi:hypothetical protein
MVDQQRSLSGYKSKIQEPGDFENPNEGKPLLTEFDEYIWKLKAFPHVKVFKQQKKLKDGTTKMEDVEKAIVEFEEQSTGNIAMSFFRVDKLNFSEDESYRSAIIRFFHKIGHPLPEGVEPEWDKFFIVGMRFRARAVVGTDVVEGKKVPNHKYYIDIPTCRPLLPSDTAGEGFAETAKPEKPKPDENAASLANALLLVKGSKDSKEALDKLKAMNASKDVTLAFFNADLEGKVTYPV